MSASLVGLVSWGGWLLMVASVAAIRAGDAGASVAYYVDEVSHDRHDYYAGHGEAPGVWRGGFAEHLGLSGDVAAEDFRAVLEGTDPGTGERLKSDAAGVHAVDVALWPTAHRFDRGHRLRVQIASAAFPRYARNLGTGEPPANATGHVIADNEVHHAPTVASHITLPTVSDTVDATPQ